MRSQFVYTALLAVSLFAFVSCPALAVRFGGIKISGEKSYSVEISDLIYGEKSPIRESLTYGSPDIKESLYFTLEGNVGSWLESKLRYDDRVTVGDPLREMFLGVRLGSLYLKVGDFKASISGSSFASYSRACRGIEVTLKRGRGSLDAMFATLRGRRARVEFLGKTGRDRKTFREEDFLPRTYTLEAEPEKGTLKVWVEFPEKIEEFSEGDRNFPFVIEGKTLKVVAEASPGFAVNFICNALFLRVEYQSGGEMHRQGFLCSPSLRLKLPDANVFVNEEKPFKLFCGTREVEAENFTLYRKDGVLLVKGEVFEKEIKAGRWLRDIEISVDYFYVDEEGNLLHRVATFSLASLILRGFVTLREGVIPPDEGEFSVKLNDEEIEYLSLYPEAGILLLPQDVFEAIVKDEAVLAVEYEFVVREVYSLGRSNIVPGSETVTLNGRQLERDVDYLIDYEAGVVIFLVPIPEGTKIVVEFEYTPFFSAYQRFLWGASLATGLLGWKLRFAALGTSDLIPLALPKELPPPEHDAVGAVKVDGTVLGTKLSTEVGVRAFAKGSTTETAVGALASLGAGSITLRLKYIEPGFKKFGSTSVSKGEIAGGVSASLSFGAISIGAGVSATVAPLKGTPKRKISSSVSVKTFQPFSSLVKIAVTYDADSKSASTKIDWKASKNDFWFLDSASLKGSFSGELQEGKAQPTALSCSAKAFTLGILTLTGNLKLDYAKGKGKTSLVGSIRKSATIGETKNTLQTLWRMCAIKATLQELSTLVLEGESWQQKEKTYRLQASLSYPMVYGSPKASLTWTKAGERGPRWLLQLGLSPRTSLWGVRLSLPLEAKYLRDESMKNYTVHTIEPKVGVSLSLPTLFGIKPSVSGNVSEKYDLNGGKPLSTAANASAKASTNIAGFQILGGCRGSLEVSWPSEEETRKTSANLEIQTPQVAGIWNLFLKGAISRRERLVSGGIKILTEEKSVIGGCALSWRSKQGARVVGKLSVQFKETREEEKTGAAYFLKAEVKIRF